MVTQDTIRKIIDFIDDYPEITGKAFITPPEANALPESAGILKDSKYSKGLPFGKILRDGLIPQAWQESGKMSRWKIPHPKESL
ncbi:MAG: hypothetical protein P8Y60_15980 [Calditrichota bacterium]